MAPPRIWSIAKPTIESFFTPEPTPQQTRATAARAASKPRFTLPPPDPTLSLILADLLQIRYMAVGRAVDSSGVEFYWAARPFRRGWPDEAKSRIPEWRCIAVATTADSLIAAVEQIAARRELLRAWAA